MPFCVFSRLSMKGTFLPEDGGMRLVERRGALFVGDEARVAGSRKAFAFALSIPVGGGCRCCVLPPTHGSQALDYPLTRVGTKVVVFATGAVVLARRLLLNGTVTRRGCFP